ncbi:MAG TPA: ATP synthase F1 subunit epsilon [Planctomycetota bacterium]|jgi:F-type H+-transporting ATPase subunit epsilon|nr:ATP synthase F1 subunit epsilon [Planctomycetota bacterium]
MAGTLTLRVITPDRIALDRSVASVKLPGLDGSIGVLPRHAPMIAALDTGLLRYRETPGAPENVLFVSGGFAEVRGDTLRVVSEAGEHPAEIDEARAREAEARARERLSVKGIAGDPIDLLRAEAALRRALMRLRAREHQTS